MEQDSPAVGAPVEPTVMQHTPGPWQCSARPSGPWWHIGAGNQSVCTVHACSKKHTPVYAAMFKANADLIAAAPELLAVALAYVEHFERHHITNTHGARDFDFTGQIAALARAALVKAVGAA